MDRVFRASDFLGRVFTGRVFLGWAAAVLCFGLAALPARAQTADPAAAKDDPLLLLEFLGGQGCAITPESTQAAMAAGFHPATVDALSTGMQAAGRASRSGDTVFIESRATGPGCTLRLPDITSRYTVQSPEIVAVTSAIDAYAANGFPGCFLVDLPTVFDDLNGGAEGAGTADYLAFVAAGILSGDLRYFNPSPLKVPPGPQVMTGDCANVPDAQAIRDNHRYLSSDPFVRFVGLLREQLGCDALPDMDWYTAFAEMVQGIYPRTPEADRPPYNAWLWLEYFLITKAAGWYEPEDPKAPRPTRPRPPLCRDR